MDPTMKTQLFAIMDDLPYHEDSDTGMIAGAVILLAIAVNELNANYSFQKDIDRNG